MTEHLSRLDADGFVLLPSVFDSDEVDAMLRSLEESLAKTDKDDPAIRSRHGIVVAARNGLDWFPAAADIWRRDPLTAVLECAIGPQYGLVRVLYFDKPPEKTWALPWHKDMTIAVVDNHLPSSQFTKPTTKAGVPHVEAPTVLLEQMLTLRIFLDDVTEQNGPLRVVVGSHRSESDRPSETDRIQLATGKRGDVLAMRPLITHSSGPSVDGSTMHRRTLHLEFAPAGPLPDGFHWHRFITHA